MIKLKIVLCALVMAVASGLSSCSVKEDRSACPCRLVMDFDGTDTLAVPVVRLLLSDNLSFSLAETLAACDFMPEYHIDVPRNDVYVNVYAGVEGLLGGDMGINIPYGQECPRIYMYSEVIDARCETARARVEMHKNHCVMSITLRKRDELQYGLRLSGNVCGYLPDGSPARGDFSYTPDADESGAYVAVLPRQIDSSLMLEVNDGTGVLKTFALGEYILAGGYDWTAEDLEDVEVVYPGRASKGMAYIPLSRLHQVPEQIQKYPEFTMFGELPSWALFVRHVKGLTMRRVRFHLKDDDFRPPFVFDDVEELVMEEVDLFTK